MLWITWIIRDIFRHQRNHLIKKLFLKLRKKTVSFYCTNILGNLQWKYNELTVIIGAHFVLYCQREEEEEMDKKQWRENSGYIKL